ncbi:hypothetical protein MSS93_04260 [Deinococcus radiodurans]|nr:hypothetical protein MSS93_04260 [Deinococcus radiodurans]
MQADATATNNGGRIEAGGELHAQAEFSLEDVQAVLAHELQGARLVLFTPEAIYVDLPPGREPEPWMVARATTRCPRPRKPASSRRAFITPRWRPWRGGCVRPVLTSS